MPLLGESHFCEFCTMGSACVGALDGFNPFPRGIGAFCPEIQDVRDSLETSNSQLNPAPPIRTRCWFVVFG